METPITIHYYQGAYGPTIRLGISTAEGLSAVRGVLNKLATGETTECRLHEASFVELMALHGLHLKVVPHHGCKAVERGTAVKEHNVFYWSNPPAGWAHCVGLLDGMMGTIPCHQYLSEEGRDDALILVAYGESTEASIESSGARPASAK